MQFSASTEELANLFPLILGNKFTPSPVHAPIALRVAKPIVPTISYSPRATPARITGTPGKLWFSARTISPSKSARVARVFPQQRNLGCITIVTMPNGKQQKRVTKSTSGDVSVPRSTTSSGRVRSVARVTYPFQWADRATRSASLRACGSVRLKRSLSSRIGRCQTESSYGHGRVGRRVTYLSNEQTDGVRTGRRYCFSHVSIK